MGVGLYSVHKGVVTNQHEEPKQVAGLVAKDVVMPSANPTVAHLKVVIDHPNIRRLGVGQAMLKNLNQQLVQLAEGLHPPIINLHELFDCQSITVIHTPQRCEFFLMIKQDPVICSPGHDVQCEAHLTQKLLAVAKLLTLVFA